MFLEQFLPFAKKVGDGPDPREGLPSWSDKDVQEFCKAKPEYGRELMNLQKTGQQGLYAAGVLGGFSGVYSFYHSRVLHGVPLALAAGGLAGFLAVTSVGFWTNGLYDHKYKTSEIKSQFYDWWKEKNSA